MKQTKNVVNRWQKTLQKQMITYSYSFNGNILLQFRLCDSLAFLKCVKENAQNKKSKDTNECRYFKWSSHKRNKIHYTNKQRLYPQSWIRTLLYTKTTINKITLYADSSTYISTLYCAAFHLFSTRLVLGFSVVQYFYINNEQYHQKRGQI